MEGPSHARTSKGKEPRLVSAPTASAATFFAEPRQPACATPTPPGPARAIGTQSATWTTSATRERSVTRMSRSPTSRTAPARGSWRTVSTCAPWTCVARTTGRCSRPSAAANLRARYEVGEVSSPGATPRPENATTSPSGLGSGRNTRLDPRNSSTQPSSVTAAIVGGPRELLRIPVRILRCLPSKRL